MKSKIYCVPEVDNGFSTDGKGTKGLIVIISSHDFEQNQATLSGLISAIKYDIIEDVTIAKLNGQLGDINSLIVDKYCKEILLIGIDINQIGLRLSAKKYFWYKMEHFNILLSDSLNDLNNDKSKKMKLWKNLQTMYLNN